MVFEATREARNRRIENATWLNLRAEDLPAGLGSFRVATFAQSFHWMQWDRVARALRHMLEPVRGSRTGGQVQCDGATVEVG